MTSVLRSEQAAAKPFTKFVPIKSMVYRDSVTNRVVLIPFSYKNGVLDIAIQDGSQDLIDNGDYENTNGHNNRMVKLMGGEGRVTSLGANFVTWLANVIDNETGDPATELTLKVAPVMTRVQQTVQGVHNYYYNDTSTYPPLNSQYSYRESTEPPESDQYIIAGDEGNKFNSAWVFKTPITVKYKSGGVYSYATLTTQFVNPN